MSTMTMDERQQQNAGQAALAVLGLLTLGIVIYMGVVYYRTERVDTMPVVLLLGTAGLFFILNRMISGAEPPKDFWQRDLPTGREDRGLRMRSYLQHALLLAAGFTALSIGALVSIGDTGLTDVFGWTGLSGMPLVAVAAVLDLVLSAAIFFVLIAPIGEDQARRVEKQAAQED